ncbi:MAG TPA: 30S ribosomal protein S18 [Anaerolineales bacterium]|nr:30S ribosomal protein S18 [Anaerolineales bacterium]
MNNEKQSQRRGTGGRQQNQQGQQQYRYTRPRVCQFCADKNIAIDYKNPQLLRRFITESSKIRPRRQTGTCPAHQRELAQAIKRSRHLALLSFTGETLQ